MLKKYYSFPQTKTDFESQAKMMQVFKIKDLGKAKYFLGVEFIEGREGLMLNQKKYDRELLGRFKMRNCKPVSTPMLP